MRRAALIALDRSRDVFTGRFGAAVQTCPVEGPRWRGRSRWELWDPSLWVLRLMGPLAAHGGFFGVPPRWGGPVPGVPAECGVPPWTTAPPGLQLGLSGDLWRRNEINEPERGLVCGRAH